MASFVFINYRTLPRQDEKPNRGHCSLKSDWSFVRLVGKLGLGGSLADMYVFLFYFSTTKNNGIIAGFDTVDINLVIRYMF